MKSYRIIIVLAFSLCCGFSFAQSSYEAKGKVVNELNKAVENAYVFNKNNNQHTHTTITGNFVLSNTKIGDTIQIGLLGYKKFQFVFTKKNTLNPLTIELETKRVELEELIIGKEEDPLQSIVKIDVTANPVNSSQEILRKVPGLFIGQHAGGGKAEQIFLRGFDVDHGTDVSISVDGMPVNMVSHAHGQGYSDLHFLIPETIEKIGFGKGPYTASEGDFTTAGYVNFTTKYAIKENQISLGVGDFNSLRSVGMFNLLKDENNSDAYVAFEYIETDGPFESPQNFDRINIFTKYTSILKNSDRISISASRFQSRWDASGQIPQREVDNGNITRFGAIDDTEGGETSRSNLNIQHFTSFDNNASLQSNVFYSKYDFLLFSNFTFFLEDPVNGDQIKQQENREIFGFNTIYNSRNTIGDMSVKFRKGLGIRIDNINNIELSRTKNRNETLEQIQLGDVNQTNLYSFIEAELDLGRFKINPSLRLDYFKFRYNDALQTNYQTLSENKAIVNPKLNVTYNSSDNLQLYVKSGIGFHSNDARVVLQDNTKQLLPRAYGTDLGFIAKPFENFVINSAVWYLLSEEELVYVGDAGVIEPSGKSRRYGIDLGLRYQFSNKFYFNSDATYTVARSLEEVSGEDYIPLAPDFTLAGGLSFQNIGKFSGGLQFRYLDNRPANEDNSLVAKGYFVNDLNINYNLKKNITIGLAIENLFDVAWNETQFETTSRLQNEVNPVSEIHFTPGTPFFLKTTLTYRF